MFNEDCEPEHDSVDPMFWSIVRDAMNMLGKDLERRGMRENSLGFRRYVATFDRANRIARHEESTSRYVVTDN